MPPKRHATIWKAKPHTIAKVEMLQAYLHAWFPVFGFSRPGQDLLYVDGFAGPGKYTNHPTGSPIAALVAAKTALTTGGRRWLGGDIHCVFIEPDARRFAHLQEHLEPFQDARKLVIHLLNCSFVEGLTRLKQQMPLHFQKAHPLFTFIDPFGAKGAPFAAVADILSSSCSEVLINLDADGIARIRRAGESADHAAILDEVFGDESWRNSLSESASFAELCAQVLRLYKTRLLALPNVRYVFSFEMRTRTGELNYYLVFASQHPLGLSEWTDECLHWAGPSVSMGSGGLS